MQVKISGAIYAIQYSWERKPSSYAFYSFDSTDKNTVKICDHEITVEIPDDLDLRPGLVANLNREKELVQEAFTARMTQINEQIQSLMAIEHHS